MRPVLSTDAVYAEAWQAYNPQGMIHAKKPAETIRVPSSSRKKPYMDISSVTDISSVQWSILHRSGNTTKDGLIYVDGRIAVALGSQFGKVGSKYTFVFERDNGRRESVRVIKADAKQDRHTEGNNGWTGQNGHVIEMIVVMNELPNKARVMGDCDYIPAMNGKIVKIWKD